MPLELEGGLARRLIADPVMAAKIILNIDLDVFHAARLRTLWFVPVVMDHSGISTGKTEIDSFCYGFLRAILIPPSREKNRVVSVYYQGKSTAESVFLPKIEQYVAKSAIFNREIKRQRGRALWRSLEGCFRIEGKSGWWLELPAGDFRRDSENQASKRINDLIVDETAMIDQMGKGIDTQLIGRTTRECFNENHPVLCNHISFLGHAEHPSHPYGKRYKNMVREIKAGSQDYAVITSDFGDYTGEFKTRFGDPAAKKARVQIASMGEAQYAQTYLGLWEKDAKGWYSTEGIQRPDLMPHFKREDDRTFYSFGKDPAPGMNGLADNSSGTVTAFTPLGPGEPAPNGNSLGVMDIDGSRWFVRPVFSYYLHGSSADQLSGVIHKLHLVFGFTCVTLDPGGGGAWIYKKLVDRRQLVDNTWITTRGMCQREDIGSYPESDPVVRFFGRGDPVFRELFGARYLVDNSGPNDYAHTTLRGLMGGGELAWPGDKENRGAVAWAMLSPQQLEALEALTKVRAQFDNIGVKVDKEGIPVFSLSNFKQFVKRGKTDGAMGAVYSILGGIAHIKSMPRGQTGETAIGVFS